MNAIEIRAIAVKGMSANRTVKQANALTALYTSGVLVSCDGEVGNDNMACISDETHGKTISVWLKGWDKPAQFLTNHHEADWQAQTALKDAIGYCKLKMS
jgi:hypothetical protein